LNEGTIPILETPSGEFIKDSQAIIGFCEQLIPSSSGYAIFDSDPAKKNE